MLIKIRKSWELPESAATPEDVYLNRRQLMKGAAGAAIAGSVLPFAETALADTERAELTAPRNTAYTLDRALTPEDLNITYNNFYEFGSQKQISDAANRELKPRPWQIQIGGMVDNPMTLDVDDLIKKMTLEERLYRHRCVEAWSMTVPWVGFPLRKLVELASPTSSAKYVRMETFGDPKMASGIGSQPWYPWPYVEGVTMEEAMNDLPFMVVGAYGKVLANPMGAPIRLHLPWKYGFKSIKSIVKFDFVAERPRSYWEEISDGREYGFWANVNPEVPHPRWSQATERVLGTGEVVPTQLFNGYADVVGGLYTGITGENLYR
ncbi:MAG: protein-methionine-sulfoxide reductase catalytic subunit MsrP [Hyphomicrobiaceae bacterium]|nr:protein-methionine-sulfoxide reductase catalytic subunit MsrP [Hyphomicrobiaceae bacterium]